MEWCSGGGGGSGGIWCCRSVYVAAFRFDTPFAHRAGQDRTLPFVAVYCTDASAGENVTSGLSLRLKNDPLSRDRDE